MKNAQGTGQKINIIERVVNELESGISKTFYFLFRYRLVKHLERIMNQKENKTLIFTGTKRTADEITKFLRQDGWPALAIHGDKAQTERDWVLSEFRSGRSPIMVATDVASRGIGMVTYSIILQFICPRSPFDIFVLSDTIRARAYM